MKIKKLSLPKRAKRPQRRRGFALIATLTLMMLLAMIATALMAMASSQNTIALQSVLQAEARQQALIGLDAAIGELQVELGPDQRVSASSGIISESEGGMPQHVLGVWNSWDGPIYGSGLTGITNGRIQATYSPGRSSQFRRWLISSKDPNATRNMQAVSNLCTRHPGQRICMVGEGTLGKTLNARHWVYADLLTMPSVGKNKACFAWWIGGENQKAKISVQDPEDTSDPIEVLHRTWNTPSPMFVGSELLGVDSGNIEKPAKLVTLGTIPLLGSASQAGGAPYFYDVTTTSFSLPVNVSTGGLKEDLCLLLSKDSLKGTEFAPRSDQDSPLADNREVPKGTVQNMPIGSWQNLYAYYNCWPSGQGNTGARLTGNVNSCYTGVSASTRTFNGSSLLDNRAKMDSGDKDAGYTRMPVMLAFLSNFALVTEPTGRTQQQQVQKPDGTTETVTRPVCNLGLSYAPMFLWWNPYNVPMRIPAKSLWAYTAPYHNTWIQKYTYHRDAAGLSYNWHNLLWQAGRGDSYSYGNDGGDYFEGQSGGDIVFQPGEVLFFSPARAKASDSTQPQRSPLGVGYTPNAVSSYVMRLFSNKVIPASGPVERVQLRLGQGEEVWKNDWTLDGKPSIYARPMSYALANKHDECITVLNGFHGISGNDLQGRESCFSNGEDPTELPSGKNGISPNAMVLGWYSPSEIGQEGRTNISPLSYWYDDGSQDDPDAPFFITTVGVVAKSANERVDEVIFPGSDYRGKIWQHSSPAGWGSAIMRPDDQQRQYHPFQLAAMDVGSGIAANPLGNIGNNGYIGITDDGEQVSYASVSELPVHPPFSLAGLAGMRLSPGWYKPSPDDVLGNMNRMQYQAGVPGVGIGNSFADPCLPAGDVYRFYQVNKELSAGGGRVFGDFYDHGLLINDAMWDRWFMSSVSDMPDRSGTRKARSVLEDFMSGKEALPVARYTRTATPYKDEQVIQRIMSSDGWKYIAQYVMIDGGFNVNSTSVEAWTAVLQGLARRKLVAGGGQSLRLVESGKGDEQVLFSRFMLSTTDKSTDSTGGYSMMQGSSSFRSNGMLSAWSEVRMLEPESIRALAEEMVKQVRKRGPFLSMSDFVNRRLDSAGGETAMKGALQAAIDATDINRDFQDIIVKPQKGSLYAFPEAENGSMYTAAPGYLIQSDVLASLGNILTVRDDTFTVRAYGCVKNPRNAILAQAWCEAVVQRTVDYVDPSNAPTDRDYNADGSRGKGLSDLNKVMGRRFRIVSFKWLDLWDI